MVKKKSSLRRKLKYPAILILVLLIGAGGAHSIFYSKFFAIAAVDFEDGILSQEDADKYLGPNIIGQNIFLWKPAVDVSAFEAPLYTLKKNIFSRSIEIKVIKRSKNLIWCYKENNECFWVDQNGIAYSKAPETSGSIIPVIYDYTDRAGELGEKVLPEKYITNFNRIMSVIDRLKLSIADIRLLNLNHRELIVFLNQGPKLTFSLEFDPAFTETAIKQFLDSATWGQVKHLNLTVDGRAYASF